MRRTDMEVIEHQAAINKLTRVRDYKLHKAREATNKADYLTRQGIASASFHALKAKDCTSEAAKIQAKIDEIQYAFDHPDFWTRVSRFFNPTVSLVRRVYGCHH